MKGFTRNALTSRAGFTLVELMVVVAIIGILAAVAIPNFQKYQAKSKASEAKITLSAIYSAQESFFAEYSSYTNCGTWLGLDTTFSIDAVDGAGSGLDVSAYYTSGFVSLEPTHAANATTFGLTACTSATEAHKLAGRQTGGATLPVAARLAAVNTASTGTVFKAGAVGVVEKTHSGTCGASVATTSDCWSIDQDKRLLNPNIGY